LDGGQQPVIREQARLAAQGPGDDIPARMGPRLLPGNDAGQDQLLHFRMIHRHLLEAVTGQPVDARVTDIEDHQVITARRLQAGQPGHRGAHPVRVAALDDVPVGVLERRQYRLGEQRAERRARAHLRDRDPARQITRAVPAHPVGDHEERRHREMAVLVDLAHAAHGGGRAVAEADHGPCRGAPARLTSGIATAHPPIAAVLRGSMPGIY
jgi:hypothetical protein